MEEMMMMIRGDIDQDIIVHGDETDIESETYDICISASLVLVLSVSHVLSPSVTLVINF